MKLKSLIFFTKLNTRFQQFSSVFRKSARRIAGREIETEVQSHDKVLPAWLIDEMRQIHLLEPGIFPDESLLQTLSEYEVPETRLAQPYKKLCTEIGGTGAHIFLVPWINKGGADRLTLNYVQALVEQEKAVNIVVIATTATPSCWESRLPPEVKFIHFGLDNSWLSIDEQRRLLALLLVQMAPKVIHNINSELGYFVFCLHGRALQNQSQLIASSFCFDYGPNGQRVGYAAAFIPQCYDFLTAVYTDNRAHVNDMIGLFGFTTDKFIVHYQPSPPAGMSSSPEPRKNDADLHILWASRIARQKRPDILLKIAGMCSDKPYVFHVFGSFDEESKHFEELFFNVPNIRYHGPFDGLAGLETAKYDLFLYTSQWDGLPNILLEAIALGLPVVSSDAGGIGEIIIDGQTGLLISPYDSIGKYVSALDRFYGDPGLCVRLREEAARLITGQHSWDGFSCAVQKLSVAG